MNIIELIDKSHELSLKKGFWNNKRNTSEDTLLIISNIGDLVKAHKKGKFADWISYNQETQTSTFLGSPSPYGSKTNVQNRKSFELYIKDTFEDELSNIILRITDFLGGHNVNPEECEKWLSSYVDMPINEFFAYVKPSQKYPDDMSTWLMDGISECSYHSKDRDCGLLHLLFYVGTVVNAFGIDIERHIEAKLEYNSNRPLLYAS